MWPDGDKYVGEYKDDEKCGRGTYVYHYDESEDGVWESDESDSVILH